MSFEVDVRNGQKLDFLKFTFLVQMHFATQFCLAHVEIKSKISYLGKIISILHRQISELWSIEVTIKNVANEWTDRHSTELNFICLEMT